MPFDPTKFGAKPVTNVSGFDPSKFGAKPIQAPAPAKPSTFLGLKQGAESLPGRAVTAVKDIAKSRLEKAKAIPSETPGGTSNIPVLDKTQKVLGVALHETGNAAGAVNDVVNKGIEATGVNTAIDKTGKFAEWLGSGVGSELRKIVGGEHADAIGAHVNNAINKFINSPINAVNRPVFEGIMKTLQDPEVKKSLGDVGNVAQLAGTAVGVKDATVKVPELVEGIKSKLPSLPPPDSGTSEAIANIAKQNEGAFPAPVKSPKEIAVESQKKTWDIIQPKLSASEQVQAVKGGRIEYSGENKVVTQIPKGKDLEMIKAADPYVSAAKDPVEAVSNMQRGIADEATKLRSALRDQGGTWNINTVKGLINKIDLESPELLNVKSDATNVNRFNNFKNLILKLVDETPKTQEGKLDLRQGFDTIAKKSFPNIFTKDTDMAPVVRAFRDILNDFTEAGLPDGKLPDGTSFTESMRKQTLLYDAIDNVAKKFEKVGTATVIPKPEESLILPKSPLGQTVDAFKENHPFASKVIKGAGKVTGISALGNAIFH